MINNEMVNLGTNRSKIRELFEYGKTLKAKVGEDKVFDFTLGNPSAPCPQVIKETLIKLINEDDKNLHLYTSAQGDIETRNAITKTILKKYGYNLDANLIYLTCGAAASLTITLKALISSNEESVLTFAPYFPEYKVFTNNAGAKLKVVDFDETNFSINFDDLKNKLTSDVSAVIINTPNNPSGTVYSESDVVKLAKILNEKQIEFNHPIYLISDEPYREIVFDGLKVPFIPNYYDNTVICYSYSKSLSLSGERIGYIAVNPKLNESKLVYSAIQGAGRAMGYVCAPSLFQKLIARCSDELCDTSIYKDNRDILVENLEKFGFKCVNPKGAFYLFLKSPISDANEFADTAKKLGLLLVPSNSFGVDGYVRIATCVDKKVVLNSLDAFKQLAKIYDL